MAKKVVATLQKGESKNLTKVIKMIKSEKTGAYTYKEEIVSINSEIPVFFKADKKQIGTKLANLNFDRTYFLISSLVIPISVARSHLLIAIIIPRLEERM